MRSRRMKFEPTSAAAPDMDWQNLQIDQYGNVSDSYDDYVDHYSGSAKHSGDPLLDQAMRTMDRLIDAIEVGDTRPVQLAMAHDVIYMFQEIRMVMEDARETIKDVRKLKGDLYSSMDRENALSTKNKGLEEKLKIIKDSDIKSMRKLINVVKRRNNDNKVESEEERGPKVTFDPESSEWRLREDWRPWDAV